MAKKQVLPELPKGIRPSDLKYSWSASRKRVTWEDARFDLWHVTSFGWCIPTLQISSGQHRSGANEYGARSYAVTMDGKLVRIGGGPHITAKVTVNVRDANVDRLRRFLDLRRDGAGQAGEVRDRISSRRAQGQLERAAGKHSWRWDV